MTRSIFLTAALFSVTTAFSQNTSGKILFEETIKMEIKLEGADAERFKDLLPRERKNKKMLYYTPDASLYTTENKVDEEVQEHEGGTVRIKMGGGDEKIYCDLKNGTRLEQKEFMSRKFLIQSEPAAKDWKLTGNQKIILGYPCQEAVKQDSITKTVAWFTPAIPVSSGPSVFTGLPGMVLSVNMNDGQMLMEALSLEPGTIEQAMLEKPKEGKKVSHEEFKTIVEEKMKEMKMESGGSGGNVIIKMETR